MKVQEEKIAGVLLAGFDKFVEANGLERNPSMKAGFFAGAAVSLAAMDARKSTIEAVTRIAIEAMS